MAALTRSGVTFNATWQTPAPRKLKCVDVNLVLSSQGGLTNSIGAALFGMSTIEEVGLARDADSAIFLGAPSYDRTKVVMYDVANATDGSRDAPADITATVRVIIKGKA